LRHTEQQAATLRDAALRLADPQAMGELFKVLAIASPGCPALPGMPAA
jgi:NADH dehydrogenase [ubiquinone] 1 alpha subcomplex assembly factor 7